MKMLACRLALVVLVATSLQAQMPREAAIEKAEAILRNVQEGRTAEMAKEFEDRTVHGAGWRGAP